VTAHQTSQHARVLCLLTPSVLCSAQGECDDTFLELAELLGWRGDLGATADALPGAPRRVPGATRKEAAEVTRRSRDAPRTHESGEPCTRAR
jgi:hypothetical protein